MTAVAVTANDRFTEPQTAAAGGETVFNYDFTVTAAEALKVIRTRAGVRALLAHPDDYTVQNVGVQNGGTFTLTAGALQDDTYEAYGDTSIERQTLLDPGQAKTTAQNNADFQRIFEILQEHDRDLARAVLVQLGTAGSVLPLAGAAAAGLWLRVSEVAPYGIELVPGLQWHALATPPDDAVGNDGDIGDTAEGQRYKKAAGAWVDTGLNLRGAPGKPGIPGGWQVVFRANTDTGEDPGPGEFRFDSDDISAVTQAAVDDLDIYGASLVGSIARWNAVTSDPKGGFALVQNDDLSKRCEVIVLGVVDPKPAGYSQITLAAGEGTLPDDGASCTIAPNYKGNLGINWQSAAWAAGTNYTISDALQHGGSSYICITAHSGKEPGVAGDWQTYWNLMAAGGQDGLGTGDMEKADYDPGNVNGDAFSMGNMVETTLAKIFSSAERTKLTSLNQTAASQAEAEAGTEVNQRQWSPLRIAQAIAAQAARLAQVNIFTKAQRTAAVTLTESAGSIAIDLSASNMFTIQLDGNHAFSNPTNRPAAGERQTIEIEIQQDATGGRVPTFGSDYVGDDGGAVEAVSTTGANTYATYVGKVRSTGKIVLSLTDQGVA